MHVPKGFSGDHQVTPSFPLELKDVQMLSVSPSGQHCLLNYTTHIPVHSSSILHPRISGDAHLNVPTWLQLSSKRLVAFKAMLYT